MTKRVRIVSIASTVTTLVMATLPARAEPRPFSPNGVALLRALGPHAERTLAPSSGMMGALVALPRGARAEDYGLDEVAPRIGRLRAPRARIEAFGLLHPELHMEIAPPLRPLLDRTGDWVNATLARTVRGVTGRGVLVGVADTGLDVTHPDMRDAEGKSRVRWMLDLSLEPVNAHIALERRFALKDERGKLIAGAVFDNHDIDDLLAQIADGTCDEASGARCAPSDEIGHGTHVAGIAASTGAGGRFPGMAPGADIVFVRVTRGLGDGIEPDDLVRAAEFMFDRADAEKRPIVVNLSLGSDFGPHDGSLLWEKTIASFVGPDHPGRVIVAAAGNAGSVTDLPTHQNVYVTHGNRMRVPVRTGGAEDGSVQIWVTPRPGSNLSVGLDGPDGEWIAPVSFGHERGKNTRDYSAGVVFGSSVAADLVGPGSSGAIVVWAGRWPSGTYSVTFEGTGLADLYLQGVGDAGLGGRRPASFLAGVREGTISLPATHPGILAVGCTVNRGRWTSIAGAEGVLRTPLLDAAGALPAPRVRDENGRLAFLSRELESGEICWFSSAGPSLSGVPKPEIAAPGAVVISALSRNAKPGAAGSIFSNPACPKTPSGERDPRCFQVDEDHGIAVGTSMSSPVVAGIVALLLERDPTLTEEKVIGLLQGGAHRFRASPMFDDQSGPGEVDAWGALDALDQTMTPAELLPGRAQSWLTLSADYVAADGSTPLTAILELRTADGQRRADLFDSGRLVPVVAIDGHPVSLPPPVSRRAPGVYFFAWQPPRGLGGSRVTFGATFDGEPIVTEKTIRVATDRWMAAYPSAGGGSGCAVSALPERPPILLALVVLSWTGLRRLTRRRW